MVTVKNRLYAFLVFAAALCVAQAEPSMDHPLPGVGHNARYATDAYPGFDNEKEIVSPERKEPRWFSFINGPKRGTPREQIEFCAQLMAEQDYSGARKQLDALVREWPTSPEAPKAQKALADVCLENLLDYEDAFREYRYLLDFYSLQCDYNSIADKLYQVAGLMKQEGKEIMFIRFANTVDVRRAYEACVLHAPGASWVPEAMLIIGSLREDEGKYEEAVKVYENLRNTHRDAPESALALMREADARMIVLRERAYNRARSRETADFLASALRTCRPGDADVLKAYQTEVRALMEDEAYRGARFYDSPTRTVRSAVNAYERFLAEYPDSVRAEEVRARLDELKGAVK